MRQPVLGYSEQYMGLIVREPMFGKFAVVIKVTLEALV